MIIYEVNCLVDSAIASEFSDWLEEHVRSITRLEGFVGSDIFMLQEDDRLSEQGCDTVGFSVQYQLESKSALDRYLAEYAPAYRQDGINRFNGHFKVYRRIMSPCSDGEPNDTGISD